MIEFNQFIFWCCHLNIPDIQLQKTTLKLPPFVAIPEVILNQSGFSCQNAEDFLLPYMNTLGLLTLETIKSAPEKVAIPAMDVLVHHLWWGTKTLVNGVTKYAAGSRKVAQRNFKLEGRLFRRWIGINCRY